MTKIDLGRKDFISLLLIQHSSSSKEVKAGTWKEDLMQRPRRGAAYWLVYYGLSDLLCYGTISPGWHRAQWAGSAPLVTVNRVESRHAKILKARFIYRVLSWCWALSFFYIGCQSKLNTNSHYVLVGRRLNLW